MLVTICSIKSKEADYYVKLAKDMGYEVFENDGLYQTTVLNDGLAWHNPDNNYLKFDNPLQVFVFKELSC